MGIRDNTASAMQSSDLEDDSRFTTDINRIAALGKAGKLGRYLWHWKYGKDGACAAPALNVLVRRAAKRLKIREVGEQGRIEYAILRRACIQMLHEWMSPHCRKCNGAKEMIGERGILVQCDACQGSGVRNYPDEERIDALKIERKLYEAKWSRHLRDILSMITAEDIEVALIANTQIHDDEAKVVAQAA